MTKKSLTTENFPVESLCFSKYLLARVTYFSAKVIKNLDSPKVTEKVFEG